MSIELTDINIVPVNQERLKAYVTITLNDCFVIRDLKIIEGPNGLFVAMPSKKSKDGQFRDVVHPVNQKTREEIERFVFKAYESHLRNLEDSLAQVHKKLQS